MLRRLPILDHFIRRLRLQGLLHDHLPREDRRCRVATATGLQARKEHVVLGFSFEDESGDEWTEGKHWMPSLISVRAELMRGDFGPSTWDGSPRFDRTARTMGAVGMRRMPMTMGSSLRSPRTGDAIGTTAGAGGIPASR